MRYYSCLFFKLSICFFLFVRLLLAMEEDPFSSSGDMLAADVVPMPDDIRISFANVGQGNGVFLCNAANNKILIIDAGYSTLPEGVKNGDILAERMYSFITSPDSTRTVSFIVIVTHPDKDHINLLNKFSENAALSFLQRIEYFYLGGNLLHYDSGEAKKLLENAKAAFERHRTHVISLSHNIEDKKGYILGILLKEDATLLEIQQKDQFLNAKSMPYLMHVNIPGFLTSTHHETTLEFLCANAYHDEDRSYDCRGRNYNTCASSIAPTVLGGTTGSLTDAGAINGNSAIIRLSLQGINFIFTGDATGQTTKRLIREEVDLRKLKTRLLMASHHGAESHETNSLDWVFATSPEIVIFSAGFDSGNNHPRFQSVYNYLMMPSIRGIDPHSIIVQNIIGSQDKVTQILQSALLNGLLINPETYKFKATDHTFFHDPNGAWLRVDIPKQIYTTSCEPERGKGFSFHVTENGDTSAMF